MRGEQYPIPFAESPVLAFAFDTQARRAGDQQHPFVGILVIPLAFRAFLTGRHDALDAHTRPIDQGREDLLGENAPRQIAQDISGLHHGETKDPVGACGSHRDAGKPGPCPIKPSPATGRSAQAESRPEFHAAASARVIPNIRCLLDAFRAARIEVIYTLIENLTQDGRDRSLDYKLSGFNIAKGSWEARVIDAIAPQGDEIVLPKTSSSVFNSTSLDYLLRNIGIEDVFVAGFMTDQCIDHAVKDGADLGYYMSCVHDACAAETEARHEAALSCFRGYCRMLSTGDVLKLVAQAQ